MKILVPLNDKEVLARYINAGADEFYLGFYDDKWEERFGRFTDINRMSGFGKLANKYSFEEISDIIKNIKSQGKSVYITMNANLYSTDEIDYICVNYFETLKKTGVDAVIISDLKLAKAAHDNGIKTVASTMCGIYNSDIAEIYKKAGVKRIIIPRDVSLAEIESMCSVNKEIEYEVFFMRNGCVFSDCYCLGMHRPECGSFCGFIKTRSKKVFSKYKGFKEHHDMELNDHLYNSFFHREACGMCALYRLMKSGVSSLKIVGRADQQEAVEKDIVLTGKNIELAKSCESEAEFLDRMLFHEGMMKKCMLSFSCYYPEIRF